MHRVGMATKGGGDEVEFTLFNKRNAKVYQIPPASSSSGHKAEDWKEAIWQGRCKVVGRGTELSIRLLDEASGELFAQCVIPHGEHGKFVERVLDSSRYFVLKVTNQRRHAFLGFGFSERGDAFDFYCCLADFKRTFVDKTDDPGGSQKIKAPAQDLSLKEGEQLKVNLSCIGRTSNRRSGEKGTELSGISSFPGPLLPPPPPGQSATVAGQGIGQPCNVQPSMTNASAQGCQIDDFADFQYAPAAPSDVGIVQL